MKKFICKVAAVAVCAAVFGASAFAKTEGSSIGVSIHRASVEHAYKDEVRGINTSPTPFASSKTGIGIDYKYAVNFGNDVFVALGGFYERIGTETADNVSPATDTVSVNNRYGFKVDLGYDLKDDLAVYFTNGLAHVTHKRDFANTSPASTLSGGDTSYFYGIGLISHISDKYSLGAEYNTQNVDYNSGLNSSHTIDTSIDVYKLVLSYKF